ncbi:predicted protein, partial [Nematostella vectensis]
CRPPNIEEFPPDVLTQDQRFYGGVMLHVIFSLHLFCALTVVCEDFFVASLNRISMCLGLKPDVAGATFMAVGSSAPTLFIAIISIFFTEGDIGLGTIVGSTIFNTLFIIALCAIGSGVTLQLACYPISRDSTVYVASVIVLMVSIYDNKVYWYEGLIFVIVYAIYIVIMYFNDQVEGLCKTVKKKLKKKKVKPEGEGQGVDEDGGEESEDELNKSEDWGFHDTPRTRLKPPEGACARALWVFTLPSILVFYVTIPDCRKKTWRKFYLVTFTVAVIWMAVLSYFLVWMVAIIGYTYTIPECVMGMTFLAAGSSLPDAIASLVVAKQGSGDMAVSNCIGSNVFDMLCLGIPWLIKSAFLQPGKPVVIQSENIFFTSAMLIGSIAVTFLLIQFNKWKLNVKVGIAFLIMYFLFLIVATYIESLPCIKCVTGP